MSVLAIQDTTDLDFTAHPQTKGLGYLDHRALSGLKVHSTMALSTDGVPLGLLDQQVWVRDIENLGMAKTRRQRKTQEKESQRWLDSLSSTQQLMTPEIQVVTITDAEGDIYDLFSRFASG